MLIEYASAEAASEAQSIVHRAAVRGKLARVVLGSTLEVIRKTMVSGRRLIIENLDPNIESQGFADLCALFGEVLDSKLQLDDGGASKTYGFVHFAKDEDAAKAKETLDDMMIGESAVKIRPFTWDDASLFTGTAYARIIYNPYSASAGPFGVI